MRKILFLLFTCLCWQFTVSAKSYKFDRQHPYNVKVVRVAQQGTKFIKAYATAGSPDKAIDQAMQDAVAACIFTGVEGMESAGKIPPILRNSDAYENNKKFFDEFFKKGKFMNYVKNVNSRYPSGDDNIKTSKGHRVGVYVVVMYDELRKYLEENGLKKNISNILP